MVRQPDPFHGPGYLWPQECLPEALQALYVRERWGSAAYDVITRSYPERHDERRLQQLFSVGPPNARTFPWIAITTCSPPAPGGGCPLSRPTPALCTTSFAHSPPSRPTAGAQVAELVGVVVALP